MPDTEAGGAQGAPRGYGLLSEPLPSLDWTLLRLTGVWAQDGEMVRCPLPSHGDDTPSFNLWAIDGEGVPQRFGCFGCNRQGDVLDLVDQLEFDGKGADADVHQRAIELAREEQKDETPRERPKPEPRDEKDLNVVLASYHDGLTGERLAAFQAILDSKGLGSEDIQQYAMDEWGWIPAERGAVAVPHWNKDKELTAIKYRSKSGKWSETGSQLSDLYGSWRDTGAPRVVLCEGESDAVWAAWSLREDKDTTVLALPGGAHQRVPQPWIDAVADRELIIALDSDEAGMDAAKRWASLRPDALLARLPEGEDLLSSGIPVEELIERAEIPRRSAGIISIEHSVFARTVKDEIVPVADFSFVPIRELLTDEGPAWDVRLSGGQAPALLRASDLHSGQSITRWANRQGCAWLGGSGVASQGLMNWTKARSAFLPMERAVTRAGKIGRSYVGPDFCIGADRLRYVPPILGDAKLSTRLKLQPGEWDPRAIHALEQLNDPTIMAIVLGWLTATLIRGRRAPAPPMFVGGESGAGKTNLLSATLGSFGFHTETNLTTTTPFGVDCMVNSSVGFPVWFDEYRSGAREDSMSRLRQILRDCYYGQPSVKGGMTNQATELTEVQTWAGIIFSGEMGTQETSHRDRIVVVELDPDARNRSVYNWLTTDPSRTAGMGRSLLEFLATRPDSLFRVVPQGSPELPDRFRQTLGFIQAGWEAWRHFRWEQGLRDDPPAPDLKGLAGGRQQVEDPWIEAMRACDGLYAGDSPIVERQSDGSIVLIPSEVVVQARRLGIELPARANELVAWLRRRYEVEDTRAGSRRAKRVKGMVL